MAVDVAQREASAAEPRRPGRSPRANAPAPAASSREASRRAAAGMKAGGGPGADAGLGRLLARAVLARAALARAGELDEMHATKGYAALSPEWKARLDALVSGKTASSAGAPAGLRTVLDAKSADKADPATFRGFARDGAYLPRFVELPDNWRPDVRPARVGAPKKARGHAFKGWTADAQEYTVTIDAMVKGRKTTLKIKVYAPLGFVRTPGADLPTLEDLSWALGELPVDCLVLIKRVHLNPVASPDNAELTAQAGEVLGDKTLESGMSASRDGDVYIYPAANNDDVPRLALDLMHESGHIASERVLSDDDVMKSGWGTWLKAMSDDGGISVSKYAKSQIQDDFAESWALWVPLRGDPRESEVAKLIPSRVRVMRAITDTGKLPAT